MLPSRMLERCACADACGLTIDGATRAGIKDGDHVSAAKLCHGSQVFTVSPSSVYFTESLFQDGSAIEELYCSKGELKQAGGKVRRGAF